MWFKRRLRKKKTGFKQRLSSMHGKVEPRGEVYVGEDRNQRGWGKWWIVCKHLTLTQGSTRVAGLAFLASAASWGAHWQGSLRKSVGKAIENGAGRKPENGEAQNDSHRGIFPCSYKPHFCHSFFLAPHTTSNRSTWKLQNEYLKPPLVLSLSY